MGLTRTKSKQGSIRRAGSSEGYVNTINMIRLQVFSDSFVLRNQRIIVGFIQTGKCFNVLEHKFVWVFG